MKKNPLSLLLAIMLLMFAFSCKKAISPEQEMINTEITQDVINSIKAMGFSTDNITTEEGGFIVEGDIFIGADELNRSMKGSFVKVGAVEQYRTTNLVTGLPRVLKVSINPNVSNLTFAPILDEAIRRFNVENLSIRFQRVSTGADIVISNGSGSFYGASGFPTVTGRACNSIKVNAKALALANPANFFNFAASVFAHELGHSIGFRHTDYMNLATSCTLSANAATFETSDPAGAIQIPGAPSGPDPDSWMLACISSGTNRPFTANDRLALHALY